jgi:hypothetical protein
VADLTAGTSGRERERYPCTTTLSPTLTALAKLDRQMRQQINPGTVRKHHPIKLADHTTPHARDPKSRFNE